MPALLFLLQSGGGSALGALLPFILIFVIFYFLLFLPSQRRQKQQQAMLANLKNGDRVVTTGGIRGTIVGIRDDAVTLKVPPSDLRLEVVRSAVSAVVSGEEEKKSA